MTFLLTSRWLAGARMVAAHVGHQVVPVSGGQMLVIGGGVVFNSASFTNKTELYNPAGISSTFTGLLNTARGGFSATLLPDGRVLVVGGFNLTQAWLASAEIYDPASGSWTLTNPLFNHGTGHTATLLSDGRVLVAGGRDSLAGRSARAEIFDGETNTWTETNPMRAGRASHVAEILNDGRVLVAGGEGEAGPLGSSEIFDPASGGWFKTGDLITARSQAVAVRLEDGRMMVTGGLAMAGGSLQVLNSVEIYSPVTGQWTQAAPMAGARFGHTANLLPGGLALVVGGLEGVDADPDMFLTSVEVYNPASDAWMTTSPLTAPRAYHTTTVTPDGYVFVMGGMSSTWSVLASTEILTQKKPDRPTPTPGAEGTLQPGITPGIEITTTPTSTLSIEATPTPTPSPGGSAGIRSQPDLPGWAGWMPLDSPVYEAYIGSRSFYGN